MQRATHRAWAVGVLAALALAIPITTSTAATRTSDGTRESTPSATACPLTKVPAKPTSAPWDSSSYQSRFTPSELAQQVVSCEYSLHKSTALLADVALIGLVTTKNKSYQNINMLLSDASGNTTPQDDYAALGIPPLTLEDGPDGIIYRTGGSAIKPTVFPNEMALAATMEPNLAEVYGAQLGAESESLKFMGTQAPDLNLDRIPNWGRMQESFGEDPVLAGEMGGAEAIGILQSNHIVVLKHFGIYGQEASRKTINFSLSGNGLYNTFLRPFAIATNDVATSSNVPAQRQVALMCSYGNLNGQQSCVNHQLGAAMTTLAFSGLVRSDLDTGTTTPAMLRNGISMIKPLLATQFEPTSSISSQNKGLLKAAATKVIQTMFAAGLVSAAYVNDAGKLGTISAALAKQGQNVATTIEERGAVLLKNAAYDTAGSLPFSRSDGPIALIAPSSNAAQCTSLATWLHQNAGYATTCTIYNGRIGTGTVLLNHLASATTKRASHASVKWVAPASGLYLVDNTTYGESSLNLNGAGILNEPGLSEIYAPDETTIKVNKGQTLTFTESWSNVGPNLSILPLTPSIQSAVKAAKAARSVLFLADDYATEGLDRYQLAMPEGQDAAIAAVAAVAPTSVALFTTGPVTMPWLSSVDSVIEMWNPAGLPPLQLTHFTAAYGALIDGAVSPSGHLPITFPANQNQSPMSIGTGSQRFSYWPGTNGTANLNLSPLSTEIGYGWYQAAGWPVLFPFGYGLTYASMAATISTSASCPTPNSATSICVPVAVTLTNDVGKSAIDAVQVYVSQPSSTLAPRPLLVLGAASTVTCRSASGLTSVCSGAPSVDEHITALNVGDWNTTDGAYEFSSGCYTFVLAGNATAAYTKLAAPSSYPGSVVHASAPFTSSTTLAAGACS